MFTISDNDIADSIIRLHQNHIDVKLVSDNEKAADEGSDIKRMADAIKNMFISQYEFAVNAYF